MSNFRRALPVLAVLCTIVCSPTVLGAANIGSNPKGKPFVELQGQIIEVEGEVSTLQDQVDALVDDVDDLAARIDATEEAIGALQSANGDLQAQIDANAVDVQSLQAQVSSLESENVSLQQQIDQFGDFDSHLQSQIDANLALITTLNQSIGDLTISLQDQIDNNTTLIQVMQDQIAILTSVKEAQFRVNNGICPEGQTLVRFTEEELVCFDRRFVSADGQEIEMPVRYRSITVAPGRSSYTRIGCEPGNQGVRTYWPRNFGYTQTGGLAITRVQYQGFYFEVELLNTTNEEQVMVAEIECHRNTY